MNQLCYRVVFNHARNQMMAVPETATAQHKAGMPRRSRHPQTHTVTLQVRAVAWVALALLGFAQPVMAQIVADPNAPGNQRPTILNSANGTPQINIQTPSAAGVSRNVYRQFDVDGRGAILNNARTSTQTQLGGWVQGNPWLANGSARVILNEVNSSNPAQLRGFVEVAGSRAQVVIASPAGIVCDGCGFINANRATLTTGIPQLNGGSLDAYRVTGGDIRIEGAGMDARQTDYTDLIARSVQLNAGIWANDLKVATGANQVDAAHTTATSVSAAGTPPAVGIDVSQLGGMYANKITLIGTEAGVGVRNAGTIGAQAGDVVIQANGLLTNSGAVQANGNASLQANGLTNTGLIGAQGGAASLQANTLIDNRAGIISATGPVSIQANALNNTQGRIASTQAGVLIATANNTDNTAGRIEAAGDVTVRAMGINTSQGAVLGQTVRLDSGGQALNNAGGTIAARAMLDIQSGALDNTAGLLQSGTNMAVDTHGQALYNANAGSTGGIVSGGVLTLATGALDNRAGFIGSHGDMVANATTTDNTSQGVINSEGNISLTANALDNRSGTIQALGNLDTQLGSGTLDNRSGLMLSGQTLTANAGTVLNSDTTTSNAMGLQGHSVALTTTTLDNSNGAIAADDALTLTASTLNNTHGTLSAGGTLQATTGSWTNTAGTALAGTQLTINTNTLTGDGDLLSKGDAAIHLASDFANSGTIQSNGNTLLATTGALTNTGKIQSGGQLDVNATQLANATAAEISGQTVKLTVDTLTNRGVIDGNDVRIDANGITNIGTGALYGDRLAIQAGTLVNREETVNGVTTAAVIGARQDLQLGVGTLINREHALITSQDTLAIGGLLDSAGKATGRAGTVLNSSADIESAGDMHIGANQVRNEDAHFQTREAIVSVESVKEYETKGVNEHYDSSEVSFFYDQNTVLLVPGLQGPFDRGGFEDYTEFAFTRTTQETQIAQSDPARISAGGNLNLDTGKVTNYQSKIMVGGSLTGTSGSIENTEVLGTRVITDSGSSRVHFRQRRRHDDTDGWTPSVAYHPAPSQESIRLTSSEIVYGHTSTANAKDPHQAISVTQTIPGSNQSLWRAVTTAFNPALPNNALFRIFPDPGARYLVETDPRFAGYRNWLSSDYMLGQLGINPTHMHKRLGDGYYEQKLVRDQIGELTGRRFLSGYNSDEAQYQALMKNGALFAQQYQLRPGIALTPAQMAALTTDIVWLVEREVDTPQGKQKVLVPQVYARLKDGDITGDGSVLTAGNIDLTLSGDLVNSGSIAGRDVVQLTAENVRNLGGRIRGGDAAVRARTDLDNIGGSITGGTRLVATAGRDLHVASTTASSATVQGTRTNLSGVGGLYTTETGSQLIASAGRDLTVTAGDIDSRGDAMLAAGRDLNLTTVQTESSNHQRWDAGNWSRDKQTAEVGSAINAAGNLTLAAGRDLSARAAQVTAEGDLTGLAGRDIRIDSGRATSMMEDARFSKGKSGGFSKTTRTTYDKVDADVAVGSAFSGNTAVLQAGRDIGIAGSTVATTGDLTLTAGEHIRIQASENHVAETHQEKNTKRGFTNGGGIGIGYSKQEARTTFDGERTTQSQSGSVVGTSAGNLVMTAGKDIHVSGSDLIAGRAAGDTSKLNGHIDLQAQNITIDPALDDARTRETQSYKQSGIAVSLVGTPLDTLRNLRSIANSNDKGYAKARNFVNELAHSGATLPQVAITYGKQSRQSERNTASQQATNSSVTAAGDIRMRATGNGQLDANGKPVDGNITITGATLTAGGLAMLDAERNVTLQAATSGYQETSTSSSKSMQLSTAMQSLGDMGRAMTGGPNSSGVSQSPFNMSRSNADGRIENVTQTPSLILADRVVMNSRHGNIRVAGSAVAAERDVSLIAREGKIDIVAGLDTGSEHRSSSSKTIGNLGSDGNGNGTSSTMGVRKESHSYDRDSATQGDIRSSIVSNNGNVTLDAKEEITLRGADIAARRDLTMVGKEVILDPGADTHHIAESHKTSQYGITNAMGGMVVDAAKAADKAMEAASRGDNRLATLYGAKAALTGYNASQGTHSPTPNAPVNSGGSLFKFTTSVGGGSQQSQRDQSSTTNTGSTLYAGETLTMVGTGTGALDADGFAADGSIRARGAQITAKNVQMVAARDIDLGSAQDTARQTSSSKGSNASVGVGFALGGAQNGFTVELGAGQNRGNANGSSVTQQDTIVTASDTFTYSSGRDTNLRGAQVIADTIRGKANRDLNIESRQDTDDYQERNRNSGAQISLCIPPFCYGATVSASVQDSKGNIDSTYASVNRQSGFYAGSGGYDIETVGHTDLKGGIISSAAEETKNRFKTGTLTTSDIENRASYSAKTSNVALSVSVGKSGPGGIDWGGGTSPIQNATNNATSMAAANLQKPQTGTATGTTKSAISPGTVIITDDAAQQKLTGKTAAETVASLNRDTANANQTVKPIFDKQKIERQQEIDRVMAEVAQQAAPILYQKVGDALQNQPAAVKAAVHGLVGGLMAKAMGGEFASGAAGAAAAALAMEAFGKNIANIDGLNQADKDALTQMMGLVVAKVGGMAAGGSATASNAAAVTGKLATEFNYLKHDELAKKIALQKDCQGGSQQACEGVKALETISAKRDEQNRDICQQNPAQCRTVLSTEATDLASLGTQRDLLAYQLQMETNPERQAELRTALGEADRNLKNWNSNRVDQLLILEQSVGLTAGEQKELKDRSVLENLPGLAVMQGGVGARRITEDHWLARWLNKGTKQTQLVVPGKAVGSFDMITDPGPLASMPGAPAANFSGGKYTAVTLTEDVTLYRGGSSTGSQFGQWFTSRPPASIAQVRIDTAVKPQWIDPVTGSITGASYVDTVYSVRIPAGTTVYQGPVGSQGGVYVGGTGIGQTQIFIPRNTPGLQPIGATPLK